MEKSPDAYRTIGEAAEELDLPQHVLRFWETRFSQISPMKRSGGRRYYRPDDLELLAAIRHLLYGEGYTIKGVQRILKQQGARAVVDLVNQLRQGAAAGDVALAITAPDQGPMEVAAPPQASAASMQAEAQAPQHVMQQPAMDQQRLPAFAVEQLRAVLSELESCRQVLEVARGR